MRLVPLLMASCATAPADLIVRGGNMLTLSDEFPQASAIAVRGERIVWVGDEKGAGAWQGPNTRVIELAGATVVPGLTDAHAHIESLGRSLERIDLVGTKSAQEVVDRVKLAAKNGSGWLLGRGWDQNDWADERFPEALLLDQALPGRAVMLTRVDGHAALVSTEALRIAQISRETADPPGGRILRDVTGNPTGVLIDDAMDLVARHVPEPDLATRERWIRSAIDRVVSLGITSVHDMGVDETGYQIFRRLAEQKALKIRVYAVGAPEEAERLVETKPEISPWLTRRAVKLLVDGALGSRGAALLEDYSDDPGNRGLITTTPERILDVSRRALRNGWQVCVHAIGDRGNRVVLDAFEKTIGQDRDHRFRIEHAQVVHPDDIPRFGRLAVLASMQPVHWTSDSPWAPARLGANRMRGAYAWKSLSDAGAVLAFGSDFPVENPNPRPGIVALLTRKDEGLDQKLALSGFTRGAAFAAFEEHARGQIKPGFVADLTVFQGDPSQTKVLTTVVAGKVMYQAH